MDDMRLRKINIADEIARLKVASRRQLLDKWQKLYGRSAPTGLRRELLMPMLIYRIQEHSYGALKNSCRSGLLKIARNLETQHGRGSRHLKIKAGTRLIRQWRGQRHEVEVLNTGFAYQGAQYRSFSRIARKITGTRWSGPAFFGLKNKGDDRGVGD